MPEKKLFLIPCCASKKHNGHSRSAVPEPLSRLVSEATYSGILETRREVLSGIRQDKRYLSGKYEKNRRLEPGPDFGGQSASGLYLPAVQRYKGTLYSNVPALSNGIQEVHLFFGSSTYYLKAAQAAVGSLLKEKLIKKAIQYHVIGGSTRLTPQTRGELLEDFLKRGSIDKLPGNVEARAL